MDILENTPEDRKCLSSKAQGELRDLINLIASRKISISEYSQKLIKFWKSNGFPDFSEKDLPYTDKVFK